MNKIIGFLSFTLLIFSRVTSDSVIPSTSFPNLPLNTSLGACFCDLTVGLCDLNCCCDASCSAADNASFTVCVDQQIAQNIYNKYLCLPQSQIFTTNTPYIIQSFQDLICITLDNYASQNYYLQPPLLTSNTISQLVSLAVPNQTWTSTTPLNFKLNSSSIYKTGDPIWTINSQNIIGYLSLPNNFKSSGKCEVNSPVTYLNSNTSYCNYNNLQSTCNATTTPFLSYTSFITPSISLLKAPNSLSNCIQSNTITSSTVNIFNSCTGFTVKFSNPSCTLASGTYLSDCSSSLPALSQIGDSCNNVVKMVTYTITYSNPTGISKVEIDLKFSNTNVGSQFQQIFKVVFITNQTASSYQRSGNPGYIVGQPLVAGYFNASASNITLNSDRNNWLTIPTFDQYGKCSKDQMFRKSVTFGKNLINDCNFEKAFSSINPLNCRALQDEIDEIILGPDNTDARPNVVATFGNSDINVPGSWLSIDQINAYLTFTPSADNTYTSTCNSIVTSASINIVYANAGDTANPQPMILYVGYEWGSPQTIAFQCIGQTCSNNLRFRITTKVTFIDVSTPPVFIESKIQKPQATLPQNFFYPFVLNPNGANSIIGSYLLVLLNLISILFL